MLPPGVSIIREVDRDWDDFYQINSSCTYCFEFEIPADQIITITGVHDKPTAQDLSLRCWFALKPYGQHYFPNTDSMDVFPLIREMRPITIGADGTDEPYVMPADQTLYFMVQNMQNSENLFKVSFDIKA